MLLLEPTVTSAIAGKLVDELRDRAPRKLDSHVAHREPSKVCTHTVYAPS